MTNPDLRAAAKVLAERLATKGFYDLLRLENLLLEIRHTKDRRYKEIHAAEFSELTFPEVLADDDTELQLANREET